VAALKLVDMKIGVFGDSFADSQTIKDIWWKYLASDYRHSVKSFGECGAGLVFSARQVVNHAKNYDLVIWCVTSSNRLTIWNRGKFRETAVHVTGRHHKTYPNKEIQEKINIAEQYLNQVFDWPDGEFVGQCIVEFVKSKVPNLLIVPSFSTPVYQDASTAGFNLFDLCRKETATYFPNGQDIAEIQDQYHDLRAGHFTAQTHQKLAELISKSLTPGLFTTEYENFSTPTELFENIFIKLQ
jgi:hypothetical protein